LHNLHTLNMLKEPRYMGCKEKGEIVWHSMQGAVCMHSMFYAVSCCKSF